MWVSSPSARTRPLAAGARCRSGRRGSRSENARPDRRADKRAQGGPAQPRGSTMRFRKLIATLAMISATAGVSALASSAQAAVVDNDPLALLSDSEVTLTDGNVAFDWTQGTVTPRLTGRLNVVHGRRA